MSDEERTPKVGDVVWMLVEDPHNDTTQMEQVTVFMWGPECEVVTEWGRHVRVWGSRVYFSREDLMFEAINRLIQAHRNF